MKTLYAIRTILVSGNLRIGLSIAVIVVLVGIASFSRPSFATSLNVSFFAQPGITTASKCPMSGSYGGGGSFLLNQLIPVLPPDSIPQTSIGGSSGTVNFCETIPYTDPSLSLTQIAVNPVLTCMGAGCSVTVSYILFDLTSGLVLGFSSDDSQNIAGLTLTGASLSTGDQIILNMTVDVTGGTFSLGLNTFVSGGAATNGLAVGIQGTEIQTTTTSSTTTPTSSQTATATATATVTTETTSTILSTITTTVTTTSATTVISTTTSATTLTTTQNVQPTLLIEARTSSGSPISGQSLTIKGSDGSSYSETTDASGNFQFGSLTQGVTYTASTIIDGVTLSGAVTLNGNSVILLEPTPAAFPTPEFPLSLGALGAVLVMILSLFIVMRRRSGDNLVTHNLKLEVTLCR